MSYPGPIDVTHVPGRETKRLYGRKPTDTEMGANRSGLEDESFVELDALLACARMAHPPSAFAAEVMVCIAERGVRQRSARRVRRALTVVVLLVAMVAGTAWLVSAVRASNAPILAGAGQVFEQVAAILQTLFVAVRVITRAIPGNESMLFGAWIAVALAVSALWCAAVAKAQPYSVRA